jgi:hypothetical protein
MPELNKNYNINSFYICLLLIIYNLWSSNHSYINIILNKLYLLNYTSLMIVINLVGLYLFLKNLSFEININCSLKYK